MADPVEIVVDIIDSFSDEILRLDSLLEQIDQKNVDPDFNLDGVESEIVSAHAAIESLEARGVDVPFNIRGDRPFQLPRSTDLNELGRVLGTTGDSDAVEMFQSRIHEATARARDYETRPGIGDVGARRLPGGVFDDIAPTARRRDPLPDMRTVFGRGDAMRGIVPSTRDRQRLAETMGNFGSRAARFGRVIAKYKPDIMDWWNVVAVLIPLMITLAGAAIGLAAAFGGVATAAAGVIGVGLLGWGDTMEESMQNLQREAGFLAESLFGVLQPAAQRNQPILERWMGSAPQQVGRLVDELEQITVFEEGLSAAGAGFVGWIERVIATIIDMEAMITQVALRMGGLFGDLVISVLSNMLQEVYENQDAFVMLGSAFVDIISTLYNLSRLVAFTVAQFAPMFDIIQSLSVALSSRYVVGLLSAIVMLYALDGAIGTTIAALNLLRWSTLKTAAVWAGEMALSIANTTSRLYAQIAAVYGLRAAWISLIAAASLGIGALAFIGSEAVGAMGTMQGPGPNTRGMGPSQRQGPGGGTYVTINGDVREREMDRIEDVASNTSQNEIGFAQQTGEL